MRKFKNLCVIFVLLGCGYFSWVVVNHAYAQDDATQVADAQQIDSRIDFWKSEFLTIALVITSVLSAIAAVCSSRTAREALQDARELKLNENCERYQRMREIVESMESDSPGEEEAKQFRDKLREGVIGMDPLEFGEIRNAVNKLANSITDRNVNGSLKADVMKKLDESKFCKSNRD